MLVDKDVENLKGNLEGDWNIQADAPFTHMIDFSHWFVLPDSPLHKIWKMSPKAVNNALKLGTLPQPHQSSSLVLIGCCRW